MYFCPECHTICEESLLTKPICPSTAYHELPMKRMYKMSPSSIAVWLWCKKNGIIVRKIVDSERGCIMGSSIVSTPVVPMVSLRFLSKEAALDFCNKNKDALYLFRVWSLPKEERSHRTDEELTLITPQILRSVQSLSSMHVYSHIVNIPTDRDTVEVFDVDIMAGGDKFRALVDKEKPSAFLDIPKRMKAFHIGYWDYCKDFYAIFEK